MMCIKLFICSLMGTQDATAVNYLKACQLWCICILHSLGLISFIIQIKAGSFPPSRSINTSASRCASIRASCKRRDGYYQYQICDIAHQAGLYQEISVVPSAAYQQPCPLIMRLWPCGQVRHSKNQHQRAHYG